MISRLGIQVVLFATLSVSGCAPAANPGKEMTRQQMKSLRKDAAHRQRRIIFNNDGDDAISRCNAATPEELLRASTSALAGSHVDSIFYSSGITLGLVTHRTRAGEVLTSKEGNFKKNITADLIAQGTDTLQVMIEFAQKNTIEIFWSMRMNDTHDAGGPKLFTGFKKEHPEYLLGKDPGYLMPPYGSKQSPPEYGAWSGFDYTRPEVRDLAFKMAREVAENYDVDGIELDFWRFPVFFKRHALGLQVGTAEREMMTQLVRKIRKTTEDMALMRGRPLLIAVRVPDSVSYCEEIGLDLLKWLQEGLFDLLVVGEYWQLSPWTESVQLGHKYGIPVYPCLSTSVMKEDKKSIRNSPEAYRARAMEVWHSGADGVYLFNMHYEYPPQSPIWNELGDPKALRKLNKVHFVSAIGGFHLIEYYLKDGDRFIRVPTLCPERPAQLIGGNSLAVPITVGDEVFSGKAPNANSQITLNIDTKGLSIINALTTKVNQKPLSHARMNGGRLQYPVAPEIIHKGTNSVEISLKRGYPSVVIEDVYLPITYQAQ